jgi:hypothetical protein
VEMFAPDGTVERSKDVVVLDDFLFVVGTRHLTGVFFWSPAPIGRATVIVPNAATKFVHASWKLPLRRRAQDASLSEQKANQ